MAILKSYFSVDHQSTFLAAVWREWVVGERNELTVSGRCPMICCAIVLNPRHAVNYQHSRLNESSEHECSTVLLRSKDKALSTRFWLSFSCFSMLRHIALS